MKTEINKLIGDHISNKFNEIRKLHKVKQEDISQLLGITRTSIINIEKGRQYLSPDKIYILCCVFNMKPNDFFPETKEIKVSFSEKEETIIKVKKVSFYNAVEIGDVI